MKKYEPLREITSEEFEEKLKKYSAILEEVPVSYHCDDFIYISKIPTDDIPCLVLRFCTFIPQSDEVYKEDDRIFVEGNNIFFAHNFDGTWDRIATPFEHRFHFHDFIRFDNKILKGTRLEKAWDIFCSLKKKDKSGKVESIKKINKYDGIGSDILVEILCSDVYDAILSDRELKRLFIKELDHVLERRGFIETLNSIAGCTFGSTLNPLYDSEDRVKSLPKDEWFVLTKKQIEIAKKYTKKVEKFVEKELKKGIFPDDDFYRNIFKMRNMFNLLSGFSESNRRGVRYIELQKYDKFDATLIRTVSDEEYERYLKVILYVFETTKEPLLGYFADIFSRFRRIEDKEELARAVERLDENYILFRPIAEIVQSINRLAKSEEEFVRFKKNINTPEDIEEWSKELEEKYKKARKRFWEEKDG